MASLLGQAHDSSLEDVYLSLVAPDGADPAGPLTKDLS